MIVPFNKGIITRQAPSVESPLDVFLAIAAAQMHSMGRLFEPEPESQKPSKDVLTPDRMQSQGQKPPPEAIYNDSGQVVDFDIKPRGKAK